MRVQTGCRDCAMCTGHAFTGFGRSLARAGADVGTLGITNLARRKCKGCGHPMSEHQPQQMQQAPQPQIIVVQAPPQHGYPPAPQPTYPLPPAAQPPRAIGSAHPPNGQPGWYVDPYDARLETWWDGYGWNPAHKRFR